MSTQTNTYEMRDAGNVLLLAITASREQRGITISTPFRALNEAETAVLKSILDEAITWANSSD